MQATDQKPDFSNPYNPATQSYIDEYMKECEKQIQELVAMHRMMERAQERRLQEDVDLQAQQAKKADEDKQQFTAQIEANNRVIEKEIKEKENPVVANDIRAQINSDISKLEIEKNNLKTEIAAIESKINTTTNDVSKTIHTRQVKLNKTLSDAISESATDPKFVIVGKDGTELNAEQKKEFAQKLIAEPAPPTLQEKFANSQEYKNELIALLKQDQNGEVTTQITRKEDLLKQIRDLRKLGGDDITPSQLLTLVHKNRTLSDLYDKLTDKKLDLDVADLKKLTELYKELNTKQESLAATSEKISALNEQLRKIDSVLDNIDRKQKGEAQTDEHTSAPDKRGMG